MNVTAASIGWTTDAVCDGCAAPVEVVACGDQACAPAWLAPSIPPELPLVHGTAGCWCGPVTVRVHRPPAWCVTCSVMEEGPLRLAPDGLRLLHGPMPDECDIVAHPDYGTADLTGWSAGHRRSDAISAVQTEQSMWVGEE